MAVGYGRHEDWWHCIVKIEGAQCSVDMVMVAMMTVVMDELMDIRSRLQCSLPNLPPSHNHPCCTHLLQANNINPPRRSSLIVHLPLQPRFDPCGVAAGARQKPSCGLSPFGERHRSLVRTMEGVLLLNVPLCLFCGGKSRLPSYTVVLTPRAGHSGGKFCSIFMIILFLYYMLD